MTLAFALPGGTMPLWVQRWTRARLADDMRLFPEQAPGVRSLHAWHGSPVGDEIKHVGCPSGYEDVYVIVEAKPITDRAFWVQLDEHGL